MTARPQPKAITIHPLFSAFDRASRTAATNPSPRRISSAVPMISAGMMSTTLHSPPTGGARDRRNWARIYVAGQGSSTSASSRGGWQGGGAREIGRRLRGEEGLELRDDHLTVRIRVDRSAEAHLDR